MARRAAPRAGCAPRARRTAPCGPGRARSRTSAPRRRGGSSFPGRRGGRCSCDVDEGILRRHAFAEDLHAQRDAVELHRGGILERLGELAADPVRLHVVDDLLLDPGWLPKARRRESLSARLTVMSRQRLPSKYCHSVMVGTRGPEDPGMASKKRSTAASSLKAFKPVVSEIEEALHLLHAREERFVRLPRGERFRMVGHRRAMAARRAHHVQLEQVMSRSVSNVTGSAPPDCKVATWVPCAPRARPRRLRWA